MCAPPLGALVALAVVSWGLACSPEGYVRLTVPQRVHRADVVVYGRVTHTVPNPHWSSAYTAQMVVYCVLKGQAIPPHVNISEAGVVPGMCHSTNLQVDGEYILTLRSSSNRLIPDEYQISPDKLAEAVSGCGVTPHFPQGISDGSCPPPVAEDRCVVVQEPTRRPTPRIPKLPPMPYHPDADDGPHPEPDDRPPKYPLIDVPEKVAAPTEAAAVVGGAETGDASAEPDNGSDRARFTILVGLFPVATMCLLL